MKMVHKHFHVTESSYKMITSVCSLSHDKIYREISGVARLSLSDVLAILKLFTLV